MRIPDYTVSQFSGLNTFIKDLKTLKPGVATDSLNWIMGKYGDHIELRRGSVLLGNTRVDGAGKIAGIGVGTRYDGVQVPFWNRGRKVEYYDAAGDDRAEVGSDILPVTADGEDCWFSPYANLAGSMMYAGSPNSGIYRIPVASPNSAVDQLVNNFRFGILRFGQGRSFAGQRNGIVAGNQDKTGLYLSDIDKANLSLFTQITAEAIGSSGLTSYSGTLAGRAGKRTVMYVAIKEATGETLTDDRNGNLVGDQGSTGAYSVTLIMRPRETLRPTTTGEDATTDGPLDFDTSSPGAGKAKIFRQDDGGAFMAVLPFLDVEYAFHLLKTWAVTTTIDDTSATNLPYRNIGIPNTRAKETPDGILCIDVSNPSDPKVRRLEIGQEHLRRDRPQHPRLRLRRGVPLGRLRDRLLRGRPFFRTGRGRCPE